MTDKKNESVTFEGNNSQDIPSDIKTKTLESGIEATQTIGHYRILEKIGEGGMGEVYRAEQTEPMRRTVALKVIKLGMDSKEVVARFESERQALALMDHPCIAKVFDAGLTDTGRPYFVMEFVKGIPITEYCNSHRLNNDERLELLVHVCRGIQHAHQKGIIHRDIKASNVIVTTLEDKPVPKIIDFGVAKAVSQRLTERTVFTEMGQLIGTPEYMSPEQADLTGVDIDTRTDVYSLGVLLYELIVGVLPFDSVSLREAGFEEIRRMLKEDEPLKPSTRLTSPGFDSNVAADQRQTDISTLSRQLKVDLDWITMKAMAKDRTERYASASELAEDILRHLRNEPVLAGPPSAAYRIKKYVRRHRVGVAAAGFITLALVAGIVGTSLNLSRALKAERMAKEEAEATRQVSDFLEDLFVVSDPGEAQGKTITAADILDKGAEKIETELASQPKIQSRLMETMGRVYRNMGLYDKAAPILEKTLTLKQSVYGEKHTEVADVLHTQGILFELQGKYDEAETSFRRSIEIREDILGPEDLQVARSQNSLAIIFFHKGRYEEAEPLLKESLAIKEKVLGPDHPNVGNTLLNLGVLYQYLDKKEEAESYLVRAVKIAEKTLGEDHPDLGTSYNNLGSLYESMGKYTEAKDCYIRTKAIWEKVLEPGHSDIGIILHNLGNLARNQKKFTDAEPYYLKSLKIFTQAFGENHAYVAYSLREQAVLYREMERHEEAESLFEKALKIFEETQGPEHLNVAETLRNYAELLRKTGREKEAEVMEDRSAKIFSKFQDKKE